MGEKKITSEFIDLGHNIKDEVEKIELKNDSIKKMEKAEIPLPLKPKKEDFLVFPDDITSIPGEILGKYLGVYEAECGWISYLTARREIDLEHGNALLIYVYSKLFSSLVGNLGPTEKKHRVESDIFYFECKMNVKEMEADLKLLRSQLSTMQGYARAISREITARKYSVESFSSQRTDSVFGGDNK